MRCQPPPWTSLSRTGPDRAGPGPVHQGPDRHQPAPSARKDWAGTGPRIGFRTRPGGRPGPASRAQAGRRTWAVREERMTEAQSMAKAMVELMKRRKKTRWMLPPIEFVYLMCKFI